MRVRFFLRKSTPMQEKGLAAEHIDNPMFGAFC